MKGEVMNSEGEELKKWSEKDKKILDEIAGNPHLIIAAVEPPLKTKARAKGIIEWTNNLRKLQYWLAKYGDEEMLQGYIDFFTGALNRLEVIDEGEKAKIIDLKDED